MHAGTPSRSRMSSWMLMRRQCQSACGAAAWRIALAPLVALLAAVASPAALADSAADQAAILKSERDWVTATENGNKPALERLLHMTFVNISPIGVIRNRSEALSAGPPPPGSSQTLLDMKVRTFGDSAVVTGVNRYRPSPSGQTTDVVFTDTYLRTPQGWQVVSSHNSIRQDVPAPAASAPAVTHKR
jgi:hypothetical protein